MRVYKLRIFDYLVRKGKWRGITDFASIEDQNIFGGEFKNVSQWEITNINICVVEIETTDGKTGT